MTTITLFIFVVCLVVLCGGSVERLQTVNYTAPLLDEHNSSLPRLISRRGRVIPDFHAAFLEELAVFKWLIDGHLKTTRSTLRLPFIEPFISVFVIHSRLIKAVNVKCGRS